MQEPTIRCPECSHNIKLTESLAAPLVENMRKQYEAELKHKDADIAKREADIKRQLQDVANAKKEIQEQLEKEMAAARKQIAQEEAQKAARAARLDMDAQAQQNKDLQALLAQRDAKLQEAQKQQAEFLKKQRDLEEKEREIELTIEKRLNATSREIREKVMAEAKEEADLKLREKEEQMQSMQRKIEELKKKAEQGSQQLQGEVLEMKLEEELAQHFIYDQISPVPKGEHGGDILQHVSDATGVQAGVMLWEMKRTKTWQESYLSKLRDDQRAAKANIAIIASFTLPKDIKTFGQRDGVWICAPQYVLPLSAALRQGLLEVAQAKQSQLGQQTKMELVYEYLTGAEFRLRVEAIVEKYNDMREDLVRERKFFEKQWSKRDKQLNLVLSSIVGLHGDLQGIAGKALQEIEGLDVPLLETEEERYAS